MQSGVRIKPFASVAESKNWRTGGNNRLQFLFACFTYHVLSYVQIRRKVKTILIKLHVLAKTAIEIRRAIQRLENFVVVHPNDDHVVSGLVPNIIEQYKEVQRQIPKEFWDQDLAK